MEERKIFMSNKRVYITRTLYAINSIKKKIKKEDIKLTTKMIKVIWRG